MLSYQHQYHAGNHADVLKHWLLLECALYLQKKDKPFEYIDTHSGAGYYDINSAEAQKTGEIFSGVLKLNWSDFPELQHYQQAVADDLRNKAYPGSPMLIKRLLRPQDKAWLFELHPQTFRLLKKHCESRQQCYVKPENGFEGLISLLPSKSRRALALIDPSYEIKSDYQTVVDVMAKAYKKMPNTMLAVWYPVVNRQTITRMEHAIQSTQMRNVQLFEMGVRDDELPGMGSSGMIIVNPPWNLADTFSAVAPRLSAALSEDQNHHWRFRQLVEE